MKKIIVVLKPFVLNQSVYVYDDQKLIDTYEIDTVNISEKIIETANLYDISQIDMSGPKEYAKGIANKIAQKELEKYSTSKLTFNYI